MSPEHRPTVIIIGAGFGGLYATKQLAKADVNVLLIDRHNFHLFTPLLYQVATSGLAPGEIAYPVRGIIHGMDNVRFLLGSVDGIDTEAQIISVHTEQGLTQEHYDYLVVAAGSRTHTFGVAGAEQHGFGLKTLEDAVTLRNHLLKSFETAAWIKDPVQREALTTMVVVGGGPTGLETVGALRELVRYVLRREFARQIPDFKGRVIMLERQDHLLDPYPPRLREAARRQLEEMGVEVIVGQGVVEITEDHITLTDDTVIPTYTLVWAAGVKASPVAEMLGVPLKNGGRVPVMPTLQAHGLDNVYVVGDMAYLENAKGQPLPMLIPVAKQQGMLAARNIVRRVKLQPQQVFTYSVGLKDRGLMATIGRSRAVVWLWYRVQLTGFIAWLAWLGLHLVTLMGFRNRISVFLSWMWNYFTYDRSVRLILEPEPRGVVTEEVPRPVEQPVEEPLPVG